MRIQQDETTPSTHPTVVAPLPPTVSVKTAANLLGVSRTAAYRAAKARLNGDESQWPTPVIKVGRSVRIPTMALIDALGINAVEADLVIHDTGAARATGRASAA